MNTATPSSSRRPRFRPAASALLGLTVLLAVSAGVVIAQTRERAAPRPGDAQGEVGNSRIDVLGALGVMPMKASHVPDGNPGGLSALPSAAPWAGPVTPDELRGMPRKLTSEERSMLRQDIRTAGEEVYDSYRKKKP